MHGQLLGVFLLLCNPARPIVSMIGAPEYNLAKFLDSIIKPYIPGTYMIDSSNDLIDKLQ